MARISKNENKVGLKIMVMKDDREVIRELAARKGKTMQQLFEIFLDELFEEARELGLK